MNDLWSNFSLGYGTANTMLGVLAEEKALPIREFGWKCELKLHGNFSASRYEKCQKRWMKVVKTAGINISYLSFSKKGNLLTDICLDDKTSVAFGKLDLFYGMDSIERALYLRNRIEDVAQHNEAHPESPRMFFFKLVDNKSALHKVVRSTACGLLEVVFGNAGCWDGNEILEILSNGGPRHYGFQHFIEEHVHAPFNVSIAEYFYGIAREHAQRREQVSYTPGGKRVIAKLQDRIKKAEKIKRDYGVVLPGML